MLKIQTYYLILLLMNVKKFIIKQKINDKIIKIFIKRIEILDYGP
jgi:hypothetical protein